MTVLLTLWTPSQRIEQTRSSTTTNGVTPQTIEPFLYSRQQKYWDKGKNKMAFVQVFQCKKIESGKGKPKR